MGLPRNESEDGSDDRSDSSSELDVMLGFVKRPERPQLLLPRHFPSKVGGRPARCLHIFYANILLTTEEQLVTKKKPYAGLVAPCRRPARSSAVLPGRWEHAVPASGACSRHQCFKPPSLRPPRCQVYCPHPENDDAFHRTVLLFVSPQARQEGTLREQSATLL